MGGLCAGLLLGYAMCPVYSPHAVHEDEPSPEQAGLPSATEPAPSEQQQVSGELQPGQSLPTSFASTSEQGESASEQLADSPTRQALLPSWAMRHSSILPAQSILAGLGGKSEIREKDERSPVSRWSSGLGFAVSLFSIVAAKCLEHTGTVPLPKDISLLDAIT